MQFTEAVKKTIVQFGKHIVIEERFVSILCDYHGFDDIPSAKYILRNAIALGYMEKLVNAETDKLKQSSLVKDFSERTGTKEDLVNSIFSQILESFQPSNSPSHKKMVVPIVFIIDASENMKGSPVGSINDAIENILPIIYEKDSQEPYAYAQIACITYGTTAKWTEGASYSVSDFIWKSITANGKSNVAEAFRLLKADFKKYFNKKIFDPIFILISGSKATDNYESVLNDLFNYYEIEYSTRIGIEIGEDADLGLLNMFAGSRNHVLSVHNIENLKSLIEYRYSLPELPVSDEPLISLFDDGMGKN
jgi:uncharacterized protein YegL